MIKEKLTCRGDRIERHYWEPWQQQAKCDGRTEKNKVKPGNKGQA